MERFVQLNRGKGSIKNKKNFFFKYENKEDEGKRGKKL